MEQQFWHNAWAKSDKPGWQQDDANEALQQFWVADSSVVFVPLCGRSPDIEWLHRQGHTVIGVELSESAVKRFFEERQIGFETTTDGEFTVYVAKRYRIYVGDFFALDSRHLEQVSKVYDRAAMVAMPAHMRSSYASHLMKIVPPAADWMVILLEYDQNQMKGPPFSVTEIELRGYLESDYDIQLLSQSNTDFSHRGVDQAFENTYQLHCKNA